MTETGNTKNRHTVVNAKKPSYFQLSKLIMINLKRDHLIDTNIYNENVPRFCGLTSAGVVK